MKIYPFRGIRFGETSTAPGELAAPPYDQINDVERDRLQALDPFHFSHLSRPVAAAGSTAAEHAAELHAEWLANRVLLRDPEPSFYPYEVRLAGGGTRLGLCALVGLEPASSTVIRRHEKTVPKGTFP